MGSKMISKSRQMLTAESNKPASTSSPTVSSAQRHLDDDDVVSIDCVTAAVIERHEVPLRCWVIDVLCCDSCSDACSSA